MSIGFYISLLICLILWPIGTYFIQKNNIEYYKTHSREKYEIAEWLRTRKWYFKFVDNIQNEIIDQYRDDEGNVEMTNEIETEIEEKMDYICGGNADKQTISIAFSSPVATVFSF